MHFGAIAIPLTPPVGDWVKTLRPCGNVKISISQHGEGRLLWVTCCRLVRVCGVDKRGSSSLRLNM